MKRKIDLSLVLACYNEGSTLFQSLTQIREVLEDLPYKYEVICIDDKSGDKTLQILIKFTKNKKKYKGTKS